jgi:hypothetical protein
MSTEGNNNQELITKLTREAEQLEAKAANENTPQKKQALLDKAAEFRAQIAQLEAGQGGA